MANLIGYAKFFNPSGINVVNVPIAEGTIPSSYGFYTVTGLDGVNGISSERIFALITFDQSGDISTSNTIYAGTVDNFIAFQSVNVNNANAYAIGELLTGERGNSTFNFPTTFGSYNFNEIIIFKSSGMYTFLPFDSVNSKILVQGSEVYIPSLEISQIPEPDIPDSISVEPYRVYVKQGDVIQFTAYADGVQYDNVEWSMHETDSTQEETELNGVVIDQTGKMTVNELIMSGWWVKAKFTQLNKSISARVVNRNSPYNPGEVSKPGGGEGSFNVPESDNISTDVPPGTDIGDDSSTGMYTRYLMNTQYMKLFGEWMWDPNLGLSLIKTIFESWYGEKQSESLISLLSFPFALSAPLTGIVSQTQPLYLGHQNILADYIALKSGGAQIDWGTLNLDEYWGNFLDYSPHTKIELYLPWGTGFVDIDPGQCLPGSLRVVTNIEFARGSCTHNVINQDGCVLGTYNGQPGSMIPMLASDIASKRAGMVVGAVAGISAGGLALAGAGSGLALSSATNATSNPIYQMGPQPKMSSVLANSFRNAPSNLETATEIKGISRAQPFASRIASQASIAAARTPANVTRNGGFGDASAGTMIQYPYVIISRPEQNVPDSYGHHYGYPSNIYEPLANLRGYTEIAAIHLNGIGCTASEMSELESVLAGGVIF